MGFWNSRKSRSDPRNINPTTHPHKVFAFLLVVYRRHLRGNPNDLNLTGRITSATSQIYKWFGDKRACLHQ
ncbi:hypothetical protein L2E82_51563 [Cichorium intybus]|nr:hypothetical protein L2E82_51563 [Cichorium intybus]